MADLRSIGRFAIETVLFILLAGVMLIGVILVARHVFDDEKVQYFTIGYYLAIHNDVVRWIWKKLRIEKAPA